MNATRQDVEGVLRLLRAAVPGQHPEVSVDTVGLWWDRLQSFPAPVLLAATTAWVDTEHTFPDLSRFLDVVQATARSMRNTEALELVSGTEACAICGDGSGWVEVDAGGRSTVRPCERCRPEQHDRWDTGAYRPTQQGAGRRGGPTKIGAPT